MECKEQLYRLTLFIDEAVYYIPCFALHILGDFALQWKSNDEDYLRCKNENVTNQYKCPG